MDLGNLSNLAWIAFFSIVLIRDIPMWIRWVFARRFWATQIERRNLNESRIYCRVKVSVTKPDGSWLDWFTWPVYALLYLQGEKIHLESNDAINGKQLSTFARHAAVIRRHGDGLALKSGDDWLVLQAVECRTRAANAQVLDTLWRRLQPEHWEPYGQKFGSLSFDLASNLRSQLGLVLLIALATFSAVEYFITNPYWLLEIGPYTSLWWILVLASVPMALWLIRGGVPTASAGIFAGIIGLVLPVAGYTALKRADHWISEPAQFSYVLVQYHGRQLIALKADKPAINLSRTNANRIWNSVALGTEHQITLYGGSLGTVQIDAETMLPNPTTIRR